MGNCLRGDSEREDLLQTAPELTGETTSNNPPISSLACPPRQQLQVEDDVLRIGIDVHEEGQSSLINLPEEEQIKIAKKLGLIQHLPCGVFDGSSKNRECVICMVDFAVGDKVRYLPCMHTYHTECIDDWLMRSFTCPSCLEPVDSALLSSYETS